MSKTKSQNDAPLHKYFTQMLNIAEDDLDPFQYRLLAHYVRWAGQGGKYADSSIRQAAKATRMSPNKVSSTLDELAELKYLTVIRPSPEQARKGDTIVITVLDRWMDNIKRYSPVSEMTQDSSQPVSDLIQQNIKPVSNMIRLKEQREEQREDISAANATDAPVQSDKPARSNPNFDAVCEYIFKINPKEVNGIGGRIGPIAAWLNGKSDGMKRSGGKVGFISKPAEPLHVQRFARYWKEKYPDASMPLDFVKFVEAWRAWATTIKPAKVYDDPAMDLSIQQPIIPILIREAAKHNG